MKTLAMVAQKGGTGKTTLALTLAVEAERKGCAVVVIDIDPQGSAAAWAERRETHYPENEGPEVASAQAHQLEKLKEAARANGADVVIIDTPARSSETAMKAIEAADLVVIPCRLGLMDLETVKTTVGLVRAAGGKKMVAVLNAAPPRAERITEALAVITQSVGDSVILCPHSLGQRASYSDAVVIGQGVQEYDPKGKAAREAKEVADFVLGML